MVTTQRLTYQDYAALEGDERYELLDGELILVASPNRDHQSVSNTPGLTGCTHSSRRTISAGCTCAPFDVLFPDTDACAELAEAVAQPDIMFISREREHILTHANVQGAPDLIVEILSPSSSTRDWRDQARAVRRPRRTRVLDNRPHQQDSVRHAASGRRAGDRADSYRRRNGDIHSSRRVQRQPGQHFSVM